MWTQATSVPSASVELGPAAGPDAAPADDARRADQLGPDPDRGDDRDLGGPDQPGDAALRVPRPVEAARRRVNQARSWA